MSLDHGMRKLSSNLGLGKLKLRVMHAFNESPLAKYEVYRAKNRILPKIQYAKSLTARSGSLELRMLLQKSRVFEGSWALYSFLRLAETPINVVVHDDGSLDTGSLDLLKKLFRGISIIDRSAADSFVLEQLRRANLDLCMQWRKRSIYAVKLLDLLCLSGSNTYVVLDSDVLTFRYPEKLIAERNNNLFCQDNNDNSYALSPDLLDRRTGGRVLRRVNAGLIRIQGGRLLLTDVEHCLRNTNLLNDSQSNFYYVEQAVYACCLGKHGAIALDSDQYTICGDPRLAITGHYCGGGFWASRFYREGLPYLASKLDIE